MGRLPRTGKKCNIFDGDITSIGKNAFKENHNIVEIDLPSTVKTIGEYAFYNCAKLKNVKIPSSLVRVSECAFYGCSSLENIDLGNNIMYIKEYAFGNCTSLKTIKFTSNFYTINDADTTISSTATIYGYNYSNAFYYARYYGRKFHDIATGKETTETITMKTYLDAFTISFRNGLYYENTLDFSYTTEYSLDDYIRFIHGDDNQINHEDKLYLGYQSKPLKNYKLNFKKR